MVIQGARAHRVFVIQLASGASLNAAHREPRVEELRVSGERLFLGAWVEGDPPAPAWPASAGVAPFGSPATSVVGVLAVGASGEHHLRSVSDGSEPCCGVSPLRKVRVHLVWLGGKPVDWGFDSGEGPQLAWELAAEVPGIGVQPAFEPVASERVPCEPASAPAPPVSARLFSVVQMPGVRQVWRERQAAQAVAGEMRRHGPGPPALEPVSAAPA